MAERSCYIETGVWGMIPKGQPREMRRASIQLLRRLHHHYIRRSGDALHVAVATFHQMDVLLSWNHRHMANVRKTEQYRGANLLRGSSKTPLMLTPLEVLYG